MEEDLAPARYQAGSPQDYDGRRVRPQALWPETRERLSKQTEKASEVRDRNVIEMLEQQKPYREIAEFMGVSIGLVSKVAAKWKAKNAENNENAVNTVNAVNDPDPSLFPG